MSRAPRNAAQRRPARLGLAAVVVGTLTASSAAACEVALVLAHDVSHSVSREEYRLQTSGHAAAFRDPEIQKLIQDVGGIAAMLVHWSGSPHQEVMVKWTRLRTPEQIDAFADALAAARPTREGFGTALGEMLRFAKALWTPNIADCGRKVLDVSGDGENNDGRAVGPPRIRLLASGVTINGLAIKRFNVPLNDGIADYYREKVIGGPGAFAVDASGFSDYARAFKEKLQRELRSPMVAAGPG